MNVEHLYRLYYDRHSTVRTRCPENVHYFWKKHGEKWTGRTVHEISKGEIQDWVDDLGAISKSSAKRAVDQLAAIFNWGIKRGYIEKNPCKGVESFDLQSRDRFLMPGEMSKFLSAVEAEGPLLRDFFYVCLLSGARRGNVQKMQWLEIDLDLKIWTFETKNGDRQTLPLNDALVAILSNRRIISKSTYVFPGRFGQGHLREPKRGWARILKRAGITNLRIHDLRRTVGSYLAIKGASPYLIGKALGHRDQRSTAVYARLNLDPVRVAMAGIEELILKPDSSQRHRIISSVPEGT